jgi:hypothetical protein
MAAAFMRPLPVYQMSEQPIYEGGQRHFSPALGQVAARPRLIRDSVRLGPVRPGVSLVAPMTRENRTNDPSGDHRC